MARFTDPITLSYGSSENGTWTIQGGAQVLEPIFDGDPLFTGSWTLTGGLCHFEINVDMDNILSFGSGPYYMMLPFAASDNYLFSDGCLHDHSTTDQYSILGHVVAGSSTMLLYSIGSNARHLEFEDNVPIKLSVEDNFHIAGTYKIAT